MENAGMAGAGAAAAGFGGGPAGIGGGAPAAGFGGGAPAAGFGGGAPAAGFGGPPGILIPAIGSMCILDFISLCISLTHYGLFLM